jgi:predicted nuclease with TOPRIM domain
MEEKIVKEFTNEEQKRIYDIQAKVLTVTSRLGEIEIDIQRLEQTFGQLKDEKKTLLGDYDNLRTEETELGNGLREKYGEGTYDIEKNTFTPSK